MQKANPILQKKDDFMQRRSVALCIKDGYRLYFEHIKSILLSSWFYALLYAVAFSTLGTIAVTMLPGELSNSVILLIVGAVIIGGLLEVACYARSISHLRQHSVSSGEVKLPRFFELDMSSYISTFKGLLGCIIVSTLPVGTLLAVLYHFFLREALSNPAEHIYTLSITALVLVILITLMLPLEYVLMQYLINPGKSFFSSLAKGYSVGIGYVGRMFVATFINGLIVCTTMFIGLLPCLIIALANHNAHLGQAYGDPVNMPSYIMPLTAGVFIIAGFVQLYIRIPMFYILYYVYGAIVVSEEDKKHAIDLDIR